METVKRDFNGAAHFFLGLSMFAVTMAIITSAMNISNYKFFGIGNTNTLIIEIIIDALILVAAVFTFMKKPAGLIALSALFVIRMFATIPWDSDVSNAYLLGGKSVYFLRDFGLFAIAMCFKKNGISGWKSMLASKDYVIAHTKTNESADGSAEEQVSSQAFLPKEDTEHHTSMASDAAQVIATSEPIQLEKIEPITSDQEKPAVDESVVKEGTKRERKPLSTPKIRLSKAGKICFLSLLGIVGVLSIVSIIIAVKHYPDYITSFGDKWKYSFNLPNDKLVQKLMDGIHGDNSNGFIIVEFSDGDIVGYSKSYYYDNRTDIHREWRPIKIHATTKEIPSPNDIKIGKEYAVTDSEYDDWKIISKENADELKDKWLDEIKEPTDTVEVKVFEVEPYDNDANLKREMAIADIAATIPVKSTDVMDEVGGYFFNVENYSKAADYYKFLLEKNPKIPEIKGRLALSLTRGGDYVDARELAEDCLKKNPKDLTALTALTFIEAENFNWGEVKKWAKKAIDYGSESSSVHYAYCEALYKQGEIKAAHEYYNKAYELYRNNPHRDKYAEYAGCPFEVMAFHYASFKSTQSGTSIIIPLDEKLVSNKCYYVGFQLDVNYLRYDKATIGVKLFTNNKLDTGSSSRDGYTFYSEVGWHDPGKRTIKLSGWGNNSGGSWSAGEHRIELWYKGEKFAEDTFRIY